MILKGVTSRWMALCGERGGDATIPLEFTPGSFHEKWMGASLGVTGSSANLP